MHAPLPSRDVVLVGAGHTNLHVVRMWRMRPLPDVRLTLVSPFPKATYSGMLPGTLAGLYGPEEMEIDLVRFAAACGVRLIVDRVVGCDPIARRVLLSDRPPVRFDAASIGIGSIPSGEAVWRGSSAVLSIKPMATFVARLEARLHDHLAQNGRTAVRAVVVGGGAAGTETALCLDAALRKRGIPATVALVDSGHEILAGYVPRMRRLARAELERRAIDVQLGAAAVSHADSSLKLSDGRTLPADIVLWAVRAAAPPELVGFDLPKTPDGFLAVSPTLLTTAGHPVFAVGDTASFVDRPLPKAGVYAVREGPVLWDNLQRLLAGRPLRPYVPQRDFLSLLATGDGRALAQYRGLAWSGRWVWNWKDHIDRKFMRMHHDYRPPAAGMTTGTSMPGPATQPTRAVADEATRPARGTSPSDIPPAPSGPVMRCHGCGGKLAAHVLSAALRRLSSKPDGEADSSGGAAHGGGTANPFAVPEDAVVLTAPDGSLPDVVSTDAFTPFLDDPYLVGRIAALHALSDVWAMGADPVGALAHVAVPGGSAAAQEEHLEQLLSGGLRELRAAGAALWGGHTLESDEPTIGYTVLGRLGGRPPLRKGGARPGDRLLLAKPLGTGTLLAAHARCACRAEWLAEAVRQMLVPNGPASRAARECSANAMTDVTGFGLAGHLLEMLDASGTAADVSLEAIPLLPGFAALNADGYASSLAPANRLAAERIVLGPGADARSARFQALFDPQTAGGLLIAVPAEQAESLLHRCRAAGHVEAALVGRILELPPGATPFLTVLR